MRNLGWAAAGAGGLVLLLSACGTSATNTNAGSAYSGSGMSATPTSSAMSGGGTTTGMAAKTATLTMKATKIGTVLTNAQGDTLYWYSKDTKDGASTCTGSCLAEWPMVAGKAVAASGVKFASALGSVTDAGGAIQATYDGYPLYTFKGDMTSGQTSGNGAGGVWHVFTGSALTAAAGMMSSPSATKSTPSSGGGYGYGSGVSIGSGDTSSGSRTSVTGAKATIAPAPATPAPATKAPVPATPSPGTTDGAGCGEGACW